MYFYFTLYSKISIVSQLIIALCAYEYIRFGIDSFRKQSDYYSNAPLFYNNKKYILVVILQKFQFGMWFWV